MKSEMRQTLARLPYEAKLRRVAELIDISRRLKSAPVARAESTAQPAAARERAARVDWEKVDTILARVPAVPPQPGDER